MVIIPVKFMINVLNSEFVIERNCPKVLIEQSIKNK